MTSELAQATLGGFLCGAVVGGVGGRLAMLLLRFTSSDQAHGVITDDGFPVGVFTLGETLGLVAFTTLLGVGVSTLYLVARRFLPTRNRPLWTGVICGLTGGAAIVEPGEIDFTVLGPQWLAVLLFVALPAAYGVTLSWFVERGTVHPKQSGWSWRAALPLVFLLMIGPFAVGVILVGLAAWYLGNRYPKSRLVWRTRTVTWIGAGLLIGLSLFAVFELIHDVGQIVL